MDYKEALNILNINLNDTDYKDVTLDLLKKKYLGHDFQKLVLTLQHLE